MGDTKLSAEEIEQVIAQLKGERYDKLTLGLVKEDLEFGLTKKQIEMYKSKKLRYEHRREISNAMRQGVPDDMVAKFSGGRYTEQQISIFTDEFKEGFSADKLFEIMDSTPSGYDMKEACGKVKGKLSNTKEKAEESEPEEPVKKNAEADKENPDQTPEAALCGISGQDFMETMKMMVDTFSNTVRMQFERMDKRDRELGKSSLDQDAEKLLNDRISDLERELRDSKKDLSAATGIVSEKEQQLKSMLSDLDIRNKELTEKDAEIKRLREEMEQMKSGTMPGGFSRVDAGSDAAGVSRDASVRNDAGTTAMGQTVQMQTGQQAMVNQQTAGAGNTPNYTMNLTAPNGTRIPIQVERTERKSPFGLSSLMSKLLPKGPAKTLLTRMIEGRYSGAQLSEIVYAYDKKLDEAEVQELLDANLPADEMHGIINVVAAAKGAEA